jgi:NADH-quinone oxidoreductase subunit H
MFIISGMAITLFLGGWTAPLSFLSWVPSYVWFFTKLLCFMALFIWIRGTVPRLRMDQLMNFAWKFMVPLSLLNILVAAIWHFMAHGLARWIVCGALIGGAYVLLGRSLAGARQMTRRTYRYAE